MKSPANSQALAGGTWYTETKISQRNGCAWYSQTWSGAPDVLKMFFFSMYSAHLVTKNVPLCLNFIDACLCWATGVAGPDGGGQEHGEQQQNRSTVHCGPVWIMFVVDKVGGVVKEGLSNQPEVKLFCAVM